MTTTGQSQRSTSNFDTIAETEYDESIPSHVMLHLTGRRIAAIRAAAASGRVLDVGCGTGRLLSMLESSSYGAYDRYGLDVSIGMLHQAHRKDSRIRCALASGTAIPFDDNSFDVVFCAAVLHHIAEKAAVAQAIREIIRVTKQGGTAIIWDHNPLNPYWPILMSRVPQDIGEERLIPRGEINAVLQSLAYQWPLNITWRQMTFIPDFVPTWSMRFLKPVEAICEQIPILQRLSAHNVAIVTKQA